MEDGKPVLDVAHIPRSRTFMGELNYRWFVGDAFRTLMEQEGFRSAAYSPTRCSRTRQTLDPHQFGNYHDSTLIFEPAPEKAIWRLLPTIELPPMYAPETFRVATYNKIPAGNPGPGFIRNPGFDDTQLTFTRAAIESVGPFDVANTCEYVLPGRPDDRCLVVSQRFYRFCKKHRIKATFIPLRIIE